MTEAGHHGFNFDYVGLGLCLSVSPQLIWQMANGPDGYYRSFSLPKKGGGERPIESPRVFLKVVQWFLADFVFSNLPVHPAVHSFTIGRSIVTNAAVHEARAYVANVDIENFFGSISRQAVSSHLLAQGFEPQEADLLSRLCSKQNRLPQGAPTSPVLANSILYSFDMAVQEYCNSKGLAFSRYADDITVSGDDRGKIVEALDYIERILRLHGLRLNHEKTRIASRGGQQRVTGVVVNHEAAPPRAFRRKVRSVFHEAAKNPQNYIGRINELNGYVGYLKIFPKLAAADVLREYEEVLKQIRSLIRRRAKQNQDRRSA